MERDGLHYSLPVHLIGDGLLYFENDSLEDRLEHYIMDWRSGDILMIESSEGELILPLSNGKLLRSGNSKLSVYDAISSKDTELNLTVSGDEWLRVRPVRDNKALLIVNKANNDKHYLLDLNYLSLQQIIDDFRVLSKSSWNGEVISVN